MTDLRSRFQAQNLNAKPFVPTAGGSVSVPGGKAEDSGSAGTGTGTGTGTGGGVGGAAGASSFKNVNAQPFMPGKKAEAPATQKVSFFVCVFFCVCVCDGRFRIKFAFLLRGSLRLTPYVSCAWVSCCVSSFFLVEWKRTQASAGDLPDLPDELTQDIPDVDEAAYLEHPNEEVYLHPDLYDEDEMGYGIDAVMEKLTVSDVTKPIQPGHSKVASQFMSEQLAQYLNQRQQLIFAHIQSQNQFGIPDYIHVYHSLLPLGESHFLSSAIK